MEGNFNLALDESQQFYLMYTNEVSKQSMYGFMLIVNKRYKKAIQIISKLEKKIPDHPYVKFLHFATYASLNKKQEALQAISPELKNAVKNDVLYSFYLAEGFAVLNMKDDAFFWLENAVNKGFINYPFLNEYDPYFQKIRKDKRFIDLMKKVKHKWNNFNPGIE